MRYVTRPIIKRNWIVTPIATAEIFDKSDVEVIDFKPCQSDVEVMQLLVNGYPKLIDKYGLSWKVENIFTIESN